MNSMPSIEFRKKLTCLAVVSTAVVLLGGCAVGPDFERPKTPEVKSFTRPDSDTGQAASEPKQVIPDKWWTAYHSDRINVLVERALEHNPNIDAGLANLKQAQEYVTAQRGLYYPQVQAGYGVSRQNSGQVLASPLNTGDSIYTLHTAQVNVSFVPDVFGGNRRQVESLQAYSDSQKYQLEALRLTIATNVVNAAIQEQLFVEQVAVVQEAIQAAKDQVQHTQIMLGNGYSSRIDLAQQEAAYAQAVAMLPPLKKQLELTRDLLAVLCGDYPESQPLAEGAQTIATPEELPRILPSQLVAHRPDVRAAEEMLHSTHALIGVAVANMLPQFSLTAGVAFTGPSADGLFSGDNQTWGILGSITAPLFSAGTLSARKRAAEQAAMAARAQYKNVVLTAFQNVADVLYALDADNQFLKAALDAETANLRVLTLTEQQFASGYVSRPQLLTARQAWLTAKLAQVSARAAYLGDTAGLYQALGGGWVESK